MEQSDRTSIRRLTVDDVAAFRELREEAMRLNPESFGSPEEEQGGDKLNDSYRDFLTEEEIYGAFAGEKLVGTMGLHIRPDQKTQKAYGDIFTVYVREAHRGKGTGDLLLKHILALATGRVDPVFLIIVHTAEAAIKTFSKNGFEICNVDRASLCLGDKTYDELLMIKKLG